MEQEKMCDIKNCNKTNGGNATAGAVYGFGFIGAVVYYLQTATTFLAGVVGILKAFAWPAFVVYYIFQYFHF